MSKHRFVIEAEFETSAEYEQFVASVGAHGGEIVDEESDY